MFVLLCFVESRMNSSMESDSSKDDMTLVIDDNNDKQNDRRGKIERFLNDDREKKINRKIPV